MENNLGSASALLPTKIGEADSAYTQGVAVPVGWDMGGWLSVIGYSDGIKNMGVECVC